MKIYFAGPEVSEDYLRINNKHTIEHCLESYFYVKNNIQKKYDMCIKYNQLGEKNEDKDN